MHERAHGILAADPIHKHHRALERSFHAMA